MFISREIKDENGRVLSIKVKSVTRGSNSEPSLIEFTVAEPSGKSVLMKIKVPNGGFIFIRDKQDVQTVKEDWTSNQLAASVIAAVRATKLEPYGSSVFVESTPFTAYNCTVCV